MKQFTFTVENTKRNRTILENSALIRERFKVVEIKDEPEDEVMKITIEGDATQSRLFGKVLLESGMNYGPVKERNVVVKLSDRIRPNSEAAPWVIAEVKKLEMEIDRLRDLLQLPQDGNTHQCRKCLFKYTPAEGKSEDCPRCGHNGKEQS